jgi:hypothetical protein
MVTVFLKESYAPRRVRVPDLKYFSVHSAICVAIVGTWPLRRGSVVRIA